MVASHNIQDLRDLVKDQTQNPNYIGKFPTWDEAARAAQQIADTTQKPCYIREGHGFHVWLKRSDKTDVQFRPSALSRRPVLSADEVVAQQNAEEQFRVRLFDEAADMLRADTLAQAEKMLDNAVGQRAAMLRETLVALRKELSDSSTEDQYRYAKNDELRHYAITRSVGKPERPQWVSQANLSPEQWRRLANDGKVRLGSLKAAVNAAIERITRTGRCANWSTDTRPQFCTIAKHVRRGDWWCLEEMAPQDLDDRWDVIETIHYAPRQRKAEHRFWRKPVDRSSTLSTWSVEIHTFDGHFISRTVQAGSGYAAEQKMRAVLADAGLGGFHVTDVEAVDADTFDSVSLDTLELNTLDEFEAEFEADYDLLDSLSE